MIVSNYLHINNLPFQKQGCCFKRPFFLAQQNFLSSRVVRIGSPLFPNLSKFRCMYLRLCITTKSLPIFVFSFGKQLCITRTFLFSYIHHLISGHVKCFFTVPVFTRFQLFFNVKFQICKCIDVGSIESCYWFAQNVFFPFLGFLWCDFSPALSGIHLFVILLVLTPCS